MRSAHGGEKRASSAVEMELQMTVSQPVGAGDHTGSSGGAVSALDNRTVSL